MRSFSKSSILSAGYLVMILLLGACNQDEDDPLHLSSKIKETIFTSMQEWYFWNDELPATINVNQYSSNDELLEALKYSRLDKWSYLTTQLEFNKAFTGQNAGHGFGFGVDQNDRIYLTFVYDEAPAGKDGWQRGWEVIEINGKPISSYKTSAGYSINLGPNTPGISNTFTFRLPDGSTTQRTNVKDEYQSNSVLYQDIIEHDNKKIGYWVFNSFKASAGVEPTKSIEVDQSMSFFDENRIDELVIDLRYNGGGSVAVAEQMLDYLVPSSASGRLMYTNSLNADKQNFNESLNFEKKGSIELDRVMFITSRGSASASELIINCLKPYLDIVLIGDNTYGKPVGSFPLSRFYKTLAENDVEVVPITFAIANANGEAEYFDGFPVNFPINDDISRNWGDLEESRLKAVLEYVSVGSVSAESRRGYRSPSWAMIDNFEGLHKEFPVY